jgi:hypothetical protein
VPLEATADAGVRQRFRDGAAESAVVLGLLALADVAVGRQADARDGLAAARVPQFGVAGGVADQDDLAGADEAARAGEVGARLERAIHAFCDPGA